MRIALFTDTYLPQVNGVTRTLGRLVRHAVDRGHEVALFTPRIDEEPAEGVAHHHKLRGVHTPLYPELKLSRPLDRAGRKLLKSFRPDVVHCATEFTVGGSGRRWALQNGVPLVTSYHTNFAEYAYEYLPVGMRGWVWGHIRRFHSRAEVTLCPSRATRRELRKRGFRHRVRIWSRGVDSELFSPARRRAEVRQRLAPGAERILLYVGRLASEKRLGTLMEAFPRIAKESPVRAHLVLVGGGPMEKELRERASARDDVHFAGYLRGIPLAEAYAAADVFTFPSDTETFGNVVLEALASGVPVVAPAKGGVTDSVRPGVNGLLVPPQDPETLAESTLTLLRDEEMRLRMAAQARAWAESRSWPDIMDGVLAEYRWAVEHHGGTAPDSAADPAHAREPGRSRARSTRGTGAGSAHPVRGLSPHPQGRSGP